MSVYFHEKGLLCIPYFLDFTIKELVFLPFFLFWDIGTPEWTLVKNKKLWLIISYSTKECNKRSNFSSVLNCSAYLLEATLVSEYKGHILEFIQNTIIIRLGRDITYLCCLSIQGENGGLAGERERCT